MGDIYAIQSSKTTQNKGHDVRQWKFQFPIDFIHSLIYCFLQSQIQLLLKKSTVLVTGKTIFELNSFWLESTRTVFGVSLGLVVHVQLPKLWCPLLMNSVLTGCVIWCVGPELQPGLDGNSSEGYSRVFIKKQ